ncbi:MAG: rhomboid family intramembrane serine protease [Chitinophagaceae bacterium]|nr:rhomboid family intramembrane serine protease [Chitinophagaceae bacterium]
MLREDRYRKRMMLGQDGNSLVILLVILAVVFCIFKFILIALWMSGMTETELDIAFRQNIFNWFNLPANLNTLLTRPWTVITYMFMHDGVWHFLGNVLWLWAFGYILQDLTGNGKLIPIFLYGGFAGALIFLLTYNIIPRLPVAGTTLEGASAGVMAVAIATTVLAPNYRIFPMLNGGIPLWVLTIIFIIIDFASIPVSNTGGHIAHLAGAAMGFVFIKQLQKGSDWSGWINKFFDWVANLFNPDKKEWKKTARQNYYYKTEGTQPFTKIPNITQKRVDDILDKINQRGYRSLTDEEKEILKRASEADN